MMMKLASATAMANQPEGSAEGETSIVGSGMIEAAPIAVKWWLQIARVNSKAPRIFHFKASLRNPTGNATAPISPPRTIEAATKVGSHSIRPWISNAAMPV